MLPDRVANPGPLTYESGALPIALRGPAALKVYPAITPLYIYELSSFTQRQYNDKATLMQGHHGQCFNNFI